MYNLLPSPVQVAHLLMGNVLNPGAEVVDATVGNGHDTLFLARTVGSGGKVYGFDIQPSAIKSTWERLAGEGLEDRVILFQEGHENLSKRISAAVDGIMFNLGYIPGGDHRVITKPDTTLSALSQAVKLLKPGGLITVVVYPGHAGGSEEAHAVDELATGLPKVEYSCAKTSFLNRSSKTPYLLTIEKSR